MTHRIPFCAILLAFAALGAYAAEPPAPAPEAQEAERAARLAAAGLAFAGNWYTTEVIVFERPQVDAARYGEGLLVDRARSYPARMRSLDAPGTGGVYYPADPDELECRRISPGAGPAVARGSSAIPEAFTRPADGVVAAADTAPPTAEQEPPTADTPPPGPPPDPLAELREAVHSYEETLSDQSLVWWPPESRGLSQQAARLAGSGYRVLFHEAWVQNLASNEIPAAILIQAGESDAAMTELEGVLRFGSDRGTRFEAELWYRPPGGNALSAQYVELREARRLGNGELHYLDHPKLGVLVRTAPVPLPDAVVQAFEVLNPPAAESTGATAPSAPLPPR